MSSYTNCCICLLSIVCRLFVHLKSGFGTRVAAEGSRASPMGQMTGLLALVSLGPTVWFYVNAISRCLAAVGLKHACIMTYSAVSLCLALTTAGCDGRSCHRCPVWGGLVFFEKTFNSFFELDIHSMNACAMNGHDKKRSLEWKSCLS